MYLPIALLALQLVCYVLFLCPDLLRGKAGRIACKVLATLCAAAIGAVGAARLGQLAPWFIVAGLTVCAIADGVLNVRFVPGMGVFFAGHLLYCAGYVLQSPPTWVSLVVTVGLLLIVSPLLLKFRGHKQTGAFWLYGLMLGTMMGFAAVQEPLLVLGASLFVISDGFVAMGVLGVGPKHPAMHWVGLGLYYLAQDMIALSVLL